MPHGLITHYHYSDQPILSVRMVKEVLFWFHENGEANGLSASEEPKIALQGAKIDLHFQRKHHFHPFLEGNGPSLERATFLLPKRGP